MGRRRANGEGSIGKRPDGRWEARLQVGVDEHGRRLDEPLGVNE